MAGRIPRHPLPVRLWHWINAVALIAMVMSGLMIFNAHPRLYWGDYGSWLDTPWLQIGVDQGGGAVRVGPVRIGTDGLFGRSAGIDGGSVNLAFPWWMTLPARYDLATARTWHFFFAWPLGVAMIAFLLWSLVSRHATRDLLPHRRDLAPRRLWRDVRDHLRLRFADGAGGYNPLQRIAYSVVVMLLIPLMLLTGLAMSPAMDANWPWLTLMFGGRQSARSLHFLGCWALIGFVVVHMAMLLLSHPLSSTWAMLTGGRGTEKQ
jgi:Ni/Fe-hydrogenase b-type cytochrome subunit